MFTLANLNLTGGHVPPPVLELQPGDVILLQSPHRMQEAHMQSVLDRTKQMFPDHRVIFFANGLTLTAIRDSGSSTEH